MSELRGRFAGPAGEDMLRFSSSLEEDLRLFDEDLDVSIAHVAVLAEGGLLTSTEASALAGGLDEIRREFHDGRWQPAPPADDLHMAVEARLIEKLGELGGKLHTARSRNDQVATDVRLWVKRALARLDAELGGLLAILVERIESDGRVLLPGYTHLQRGQPILLGHQLLAHAWPLTRDRERFAAAKQRLDRSPLGACAMAGTPHPIDRRRGAALLGFADVVENAMDAVSARDHLQEVTSACAICMTHLSRMAEEIVLWSSSEFRFARVGDTYATGSSIMPQKRNPDGAELIRGKTARVHADLLTLLGLVKALPLAYNRDLQEDKRPLFDAMDTTTASLRMMGRIWRTLELDRNRFEDELLGDFSLATELADCLVQQGFAFRRAHEIVAGVVAAAERAGKKLDGLGADELRRLSPEGADLTAVGLDPFAAAERRTSRGGTSTSEIARQLELLRAMLPDA